MIPGEITPIEYTELPVISGKNTSREVDQQETVVRRDRRDKK
jgi:hypothetical protein